MSTLKKELEAVKYHELKGILEEKGLGQVWKPGKKMVDIISEAVAKSKEVEKFKAEGLDQETIDNKLQEIDKSKEIELEKEKEKAQEGEVKEVEELQSTMEKKYTGEDGKLDLEAMKNALAVIKNFIKAASHNKKKRRGYIQRKNELNKLILKAEKQ